MALNEAGHPSDLMGLYKKYHYKEYKGLTSKIHILDYNPLLNFEGVFEHKKKEPSIFV